MTDPSDLVAIEAAAARAVPAAETAVVGGWLARATPGVATRRANSVLAVADDPRSPLPGRLAAVENFYARRGRPVCFQLTPVSRPAGLPAWLARRGYVRRSPTVVYAGVINTLGVNEPGLVVSVDATPGPAWVATWCEALGTDPARVAGLRALWRRISVPCAFATVAWDGEPAGVGMGVVDGDRLGIFNMATRAAVRRRGVARAALRALDTWGAGHGARSAYLQVDGANHGARTLYRSVGLTEAYEYTYLIRAGNAR